MALFRFVALYLALRLAIVKNTAKAGIKICDTAKVGLKVSLSLMGAVPASLFLLMEGEF